MRTRWIVLATIAVTAILVVGLAGAAWYFNGRSVALAQGPGGWGMMGRFFGGNANATPAPLGQPGFWGPMGMMGRYFGGSTNVGGVGSMPCWGGNTAPVNPSGEAISIEQAQDAIEKYVASLGYGNLEVDEVMEFTQNFYAIVKEADTNIGAMELLVDKYSGIVGPEYGPNMMWNDKYGMHAGGLASCCAGGAASGAMTVKPEEALSIAQRWLDTNRPGVSVESHADPFYGYYTVHTLKDGKVNGMLSVHGSTGQVWYHNWHGDFIQMIG